MAKARKIEERSALIIVDVQNDFCPSGALPVPDGDKVVKPINQMIDRFQSRGELIIYSLDWHPKQTKHFKKYGGIWPVHCVKGTEGADLHPNLKVLGRTIYKGSSDADDGYSAFEGVKPGVDALKEKFLKRVYLVKDACRAVNLKPGDGKRALEEITDAGAIITTTKEVLE